jgi:hypothetical protein
LEEVRTGAGGGPLYTGHYGSLRISALTQYCVIDRCAAEVGVIDWTVRGGGTRTAGLRPRAIDPGILSNRASFFQGLRASIAEVGVKVPVLVWGIKGKLYLRYGASRVYTCEGLGIERIPAILCLYDREVPQGFLCLREVNTPAEVLAAFGPPREVGHFIVDHEKIDAHRMEP